jgi:hypothetical protein
MKLYKKTKPADISGNTYTISVPAWCCHQRDDHTLRRLQLLSYLRPSKISPLVARPPARLSHSGGDNPVGRVAHPGNTNLLRV